MSGGTLNSMSLGDLIGVPSKRIVRPKLQPRCTSWACTRYKDEKGKYKFHAFRVLDVKKTVDACPHCGHIIFWHNPSLDDTEEQEGSVG